MAQPLLEVLSTFPGFLTAHRVDGAGILGVALAIGVLAPLAVGLAAHVASKLGDRISARIASNLLRTSVPAASAGLLALVSTVRRLPSAASIGVALVAAASIALLLSRRQPAGGDPSSAPLPHRFLALLALGLVVFPGNFLLSKSIRPLWLQAQAAAAETPDLKLEAQTPIVMVVFDELPIASLMAAGGESIDGNRFPGFERLAQSSTWYRHALAVAPSTFQSLPAMLTGRAPLDDASPTVAAYPDNLFTLLAGNGYEVSAIENLTRLCPDSICEDSTPRESLRHRSLDLADDLLVVYLHQITPQALRPHLPDITNSWRDFRRQASEADGFGDVRRVEANPERAPIPDLVSLFLNRLEPTSEEGSATLSYLHLNLPHVPYQYLPDGRQYGPVGMSIVPHGFHDNLWQGSQWQMTQAYQRHLLQTQYADRILAQILDQLEASERFDQSLIIVTADHGASFLFGQPRRTPVLANLSDIYEVPFFIKYPGQEQALVTDRAVSHYDLLPTIIDVLGGSMPLSQPAESAPREALLGHSLEGPGPTDPAPIWYLEDHRNKSDRTFGHIDPEQRRRAFASRQQLISSDQDLYLLDLPAELFGTSTADRVDTFVEPPQLRYRLNSPHQWHEIDPQGRSVPAHVVGSLEPADELGLDESDEPDWPEQLAISVDGRLTSLTRPFRARNGTMSFTSILSPSTLQGGSAELAVFAVTAGGDLLPLRRMNPAPPELTGPSVTLAIQIEGEGRVPIVPLALTGGYEIFPTRIDGWASLARNRFAPYEELLVFDRENGSRFVFRGVGRRLPRPIDGNSSWTGFSILLAEGQLDSETARVFARYEGAISELRPSRADSLRNSFPLANLDIDRSTRPHRLVNELDGFPIRPRGLLGNISAASLTGKGQREILTIEGWAAQEGNRLPAGAIAVTSGDRAVAGVRRVESSAAIQEQFGHRLTDLYSFTLQIERPRELPAPDRLRVFALGAEGTAVELQADGRRVRHLLAELSPSLSATQD